MDISLPVQLNLHKLNLLYVFFYYNQSLPSDNNKIKSLLAGSLYAYELPAITNIATMTAEEETKNHNNQGLSQIQRLHNSRKNTHYCLLWHPIVMEYCIIVFLYLVR